MDGLIVVLLAAVLVLSGLALAGVWRLSRRQQPDPDAPGTDLVPASPVRPGLPPTRDGTAAPARLPEVSVEERDPSHVVLRVSDEALATLSFSSGEADTGPEVAANPGITAALVEMARVTPDVLRAAAAGDMRITFSKSTLQGLTDGSLRWMSGGHAVAVDAASRQTVELGKLAGPELSRLAGTWPMLLSGGVAAAAAALQQQQLNAALAAIETGIDELYQRQIDDDAGVLHAAAELATTVIDASQRGHLPDQLTRELAVARRDVEAIYYARRESVRRFIADIERAQDAHEAKTGESKPWSKGVENAFGDTEQFRGDTLAFVRAAAIKAHLAASTAAVVATENRPDVAFKLMSASESTLRTDVFDLRRRLEALAAVEPDRLPLALGRSRVDAHDVCVSLVDELERHITPLLPLDGDDTVTFAIDRTHILKALPAPSATPDIVQTLDHARQERQL